MSTNRLYLQSKSGLGASYLDSPHTELPLDVDRNDVFEYLQRFGSLVELKIIASKSFSYGFAQFASSADAEAVLETFRGRRFLGSDTTIEPARPMRKDREPSYESRRVRVPPRFPVVVENLGRHIRWQELKDFARLSGGFVAFCDVEQGNTGRGFIEYHTQKDAETALKTLNGRKLGGLPVRLSVPSRSSRRSSRSRSPARLPTQPAPYSLSRRSSATSSSPGDTPAFSLFSRAAASYRARLAEPRAHRLEPASPESTKDTILNSDYDYDSYLRVKYEQRLQQIHGCYHD
ncbi:hypothetical protein C8F01DRAFT_1246712 [Mycena amicta]|nr:hypothetical protein C8F01DRAFT_1246712 [Mycena amicta]